MSTPTIKSAFDEICKDLVITPEWVKNLARFRVGFTVRNTEHIDFFGGNLFGVQQVRFTPMDRAYVFEELLQVDESTVERALNKVPTVIRRFHVTGDNFNNACVWLMHRIYRDNGLDDKTKHQAMTDVCLLLNYRFFTSLLVRRFSESPANPEIALAVYNGLSRKFAIKDLKSWNRVFEARVAEILNPKGIHWRTITTMDDDIKGVRYMLSDTQGRLRSMANLLMREHMNHVEEQSRVITTSATMEHDGEEIIKDQTNALLSYNRYLTTIVTEQPAFIKKELVGVIESMVTTMPSKQFLEVLVHMSSTRKQEERNEVLGIIDETLAHAFAYLYSNRQMIRNTSDLPTILIRLKGTYTSSRNTDRSLLALRKRVEKLVAKITKIRHAGNISAVRTGILLYLVARALTKKYYSS